MVSSVELMEKGIEQVEVKRVVLEMGAERAEREAYSSRGRQAFTQLWMYLAGREQCSCRDPAGRSAIKHVTQTRKTESMGVTPPCVTMAYQ